jgi:DNA-binding response OmpR family regulator
MASIIMIDDSPTVCLAVRAELMRDRHSVHRLESPIDIPRYLRLNQVDLILLDLEMPVFSGFSIGALLKSFDKKRTPIVVYSSRPVQELRSTAAKIGAVGFMEKARPLNDLRALVNRIVGSRAA